MQENLPPCGLFRTTEALEGKEQWVRAGMLVYFHNHSQQGPPLVLLPSENQDNRWIFHEKGYLIRDLGYSETLEALKPEGLYILEERSEEHTSELQSRPHLVCRLLLEKK